MARYRKVDPRIWNDAKFRSLSDNAKLVFFMLLTHPGMTALGAMRATVPGLAAEMDWTTEAFREAFMEVIAEGMAEHDEKACFVCLPNFIRYNEPENPNVVKAWVGALDMLPECEQRNLTLARAVAYAKAKSEAFAEALPKAFLEALSKGMPKQEQEQEQEQKDMYVASEALPTAAPVAQPDDRGLPPVDNKQIFALYHEVLPELPRVRLMTDARQRALAKRWRWLFTSRREDGSIRAETAEEALAWFREFFDRVRDSDWLMGRGARAKGHESWQCDLDFLLSDKGLLAVVEKTAVAA